jgi:hypothetical protein
MDVDPPHVTEVLRGLYYETALAGSRNSLLPTLEVTTADHILFGTDWTPEHCVTALSLLDDEEAVTVGIAEGEHRRYARPAQQLVDLDSLVAELLMRGGGIP